jgi:hypothetical protein
LSFAEFIYNNSKHQVLQDTPFYIYYGYHSQLLWNPEDRIIGEVPAIYRRLETLKAEQRKLEDL